MNVPKLRFTEFSDSWVDISLGSVSRNVMYGMNSAAIPYDGINKYIRITDIDDETRDFIPAPLTSPDGEIEEKYRLNKGDLLFARTGASVGKSYLYKEKDGNLFFAGFLVKFSVVEANPYFVYLQTLTATYKGWLKVMSMRSGQPGVNAEELKELKFSAPQLIEQNKIANFFTAIDEKISQLTKKHELLTEYKKGVMQKIFNQELRFKDDDGSNFPDWVPAKIKDVSISESSNISANSIDSNTGNYKIYGASGLLKLINFFISDEPYLAVVKDGSGVGRVFVCDANSSVLGTLQIIKPKKNIHLYFLCCLIQNIDFSKYIAGGAIPHIYYKDYSKESILLPAFDEQVKIANLLQAIDEKISQAQSQLELVRQYKQGLLQQMFI